MKIALGSDHRGYGAKRHLLSFLKNRRHEVEDLGCAGSASVDYPDIAYAVSVPVASQTCELGILLGGSGMGMCLAANKVHGILAANVADEFTARRAREQYHCNIICIACDLVGNELIERIVEAFLTADLATGRYGRRVEKVRQIERELEPRRIGDGAAGSSQDRSLRK